MTVLSTRASLPDTRAPILRRGRFGVFPPRRYTGAPTRSLEGGQLTLFVRRLDLTLSTPRIKSTAILIGFDPDGRCVYSEILDIHDYYDGEHVWDESEEIIRLTLQRMRGYLFDSDGELDQEFESVFDLSTGMYTSGYARFADGTVRRDGPAA